MKDFVKKTDSFQFEMIVIILTFLFYLFRPAIPVFKYPFILLYFYLIICSFIRYKGQIISSFREFVKNYFLVLFLILIFLVSFILSNKLYLIIFKDAFNGIILLSIFFLLSLRIATRNDLNRIVYLLLLLVIVFSIVISVNGLCRLLDIFPGGEVYPLTGNFAESATSAFEIDNNFGILPVILGILALFFFLFKTDSLLYILFGNFFLIVYTLSLFLSGSRRGLILLSMIIFFLALTQVSRVIKWKKTLGRVGSKSIYLLITIIVLASISWYITFYTSNTFKNKTLEAIGSKNILNTKIKITSVISRYTSIFNKSLSFIDLYNIIWTPEFNSLDPESSWGTRNHKTIYPLTGKNVEIIPKGAKGYLMDSTCNSSSESTYCDSFSLLTKLTVKKGERYRASVNCFVSEDFDADIVRLSVGTDCIIKNIVFGSPVAIYDFNSKGMWKRLEINFECNSGIVPIYISFVKNGVKDFSKLKGYVIFAYPQIENLMTKASAISNSELNFDITEDHSTKNEIHSFSPVTNNKITRVSLFDLNISLKNRFLQNGSNQNDPIRNWASKFISEDTTYHPYKAIIVLDTNSIQLSEGRFIRWQFAWQIFIKEYDWPKKLIGGGFNHLNWYGYYFLKDKTKSDWPHNPFLSILLYSGIVGLLIYCFFLYKVFYYYLKYKREYPLLFIFFLITFFFSFFSGGSPFDPPIMGFFVILPFFIHSIHMKNNHELNN